jgi:hypothetical protein
MAAGRQWLAVRVRRQPASRGRFQTRLTGFVGFTKIFKYLGSSVSSSLNDDGEVDQRIKADGALFGKWRKAVFQHRNIPLSCKKLAYEGIILATLLYGCEAWAITAKSLDKLQKFHRKSTRQM